MGGWKGEGMGDYKENILQTCMSLSRITFKNWVNSFQSVMHCNEAYCFITNFGAVFTCPSKCKAWVRICYQSITLHNTPQSDWTLQCFISIYISIYIYIYIIYIYIIYIHSFIILGACVCACVSICASWAYRSTW